VTYTIRVHSAADAEHARTIAWLLEHVSPDHAITYATAISKALDEILETIVAFAHMHRAPGYWLDRLK
jgi:hypothetical protein